MVAVEAHEFAIDMIKWNGYGNSRSRPWESLGTEKEVVILQDSTLPFQHHTRFLSKHGKAKFSAGNEHRVPAAKAAPTHIQHDHGNHELVPHFDLKMISTWPQHDLNISGLEIFVDPCFTCQIFGATPRATKMCRPAMTRPAAGNLGSPSLRWSWSCGAKRAVWTLSGWWARATPLKNMKVNWDDDIPNIWENKKCSKPPTSYHVGVGME